MRVPPKVTVVEVGPRDGLQNERAAIATADKIALIDKLCAAWAVLDENGKDPRKLGAFWIFTSMPTAFHSSTSTCCTRSRSWLPLVVV